MKIAQTILAGRPYFWIFDKLADLYDKLTSAAHLLTSSYGIGGLVIGLLLLIVLVRKFRNA